MPEHRREKKHHPRVVNRPRAHQHENGGHGNENDPLTEDDRDDRLRQAIDVPEEKKARISGVMSRDRQLPQRKG
jgi:hypothetical protein